MTCLFPRERGGSIRVDPLRAPSPKPHRISREKEEAMQRLFAPAVILWLAACGVAQAQTQTSSSPSSNTTTTGTSAPNSAASVTGPAVASQPVPGGTSFNDTSAD